MKPVESANLSVNESLSEVKRDRERDKKKESKKIKVAKDAEAHMKNGSREGRLTMVFGENAGVQKVDNAERNGESCSGLTKDNAEKKRRENKKNKNKKFHMHDTEEIKGDETINWSDGGSGYGKENVKEVMEEKKKRKVNRNSIKEGEKDGEVTRARREKFIVNAREVRKKRKKHKKKSKYDNILVSTDIYNEAMSDEFDLSTIQHENASENVEDHTRLNREDGNAKRNHERKKKRKQKEIYKDDLAAGQQEFADNDINSLLKTNKTQNNETECTEKSKRKTVFMKNDSDGGRNNEAGYADKGKKRKCCLVVKGSNDISPNRSNKKVRFSGQDEIFHLPSNSNTEQGNGEEYLVRGKRFTHEEDELVKNAVLNYIEEHGLGDEGLKMVLDTRKHPKLRGCWKEITSVIPYRPHFSVYGRARVLFMRSESRKWTQEEYDMIKKYQKEHGNQWRAIADELGKHTWHVKDTWRRIKLPNLKKGRWSQDEYQKLFDLVNTDLQIKLSEDKRSQHGMLRDNVCWTAISDSLSSRTQSSCCKKWYLQMTSPMVVQGVWADSDDYRLLGALYSLDATCSEDVEWDDLIDNRSGDVCRKRWSQMVRHIGDHGNKSFAEQVEVLAQRYCPHLLEAREIWDSKPRVP